MSDTNLDENYEVITSSEIPDIDTTIITTSEMAAQ